MAHGGGVLDMKKRFEQSSSDAPVPVKKPPVSTKPKPSWVKPESTATGNDNAQNDTARKFGGLASNHDGNTHSPGTKTWGAPNQALKPKVLSKPADSNNNKNGPLNEKKSTGSSDIANLSNENLGKVSLPKFPKPVDTNTAKPPVLSKTSGFGSKPAFTNKPNVSDKAKVTSDTPPVASKPEVSKSVSASSSTSSSSDSSSSFSLSNPSSASTFHKSPLEKGQIDFSKNLRPVGRGVPTKKVLDSVGSDTSSQSPKSPTTQPSHQPVPKSPSIPPSESSTTTTDDDKQEPPPVSKTSVDLIELRGKLKPKTPKRDATESEETPVIQRESDGRKFRKIAFNKSLYPSEPPEKPSLPTDIDLSTLHDEYKKAVSKQDAQQDAASKAPINVVEEEADELYCEGISLVDSRSSQTANSRQSERISLIPEITAEDEGAYDVTPTDDVYTDAMSETQVESKETSKTDSEETEQEKKAKKRKEKEKRDKKEKKEKEEMRQRKKFKLTGDELMVGEGTIKDDAKGSGLNLKVRKDQAVTIVRIDNNPQNKWLVKTENQMGYVDSHNISVDPIIIKQAMTSHRKESIVEEDADQPTYDAVPEDTSGSGSTPIVEELEYEDVYEDCQ